MSSRTQVKPEVAPKPTDLLVRQKCEAMIQYGYVALRQFPTFERHVLAAEIRYMDDFVVIHHDKAHLQRVRERMECFLAQRLRLQTNRKTQVFPVGVLHGRALDFLGYQIWPTHRRLRRDSITRIGRSLRALQHYYARGLVSLERVHQTVQSWCEQASHANTYRLRTAVLKKFAFVRCADVGENTLRSPSRLRPRHRHEVPA